MSAIERAAEVLEHGHPGEMLTALGEAWMTCGCGHSIKVTVEGGVAKVGAANDEYRAHVGAAFAAAGLLADPDRRDQAGEGLREAVHARIAIWQRSVDQYRRLHVRDPRISLGTVLTVLRDVLAAADGGTQAGDA